MRRPRVAFALMGLSSMMSSSPCSRSLSSGSGSYVEPLRAGRIAFGLMIGIPVSVTASVAPPAGRAGSGAAPCCELRCRVGGGGGGEEDVSTTGEGIVLGAGSGEEKPEPANGTGFAVGVDGSSTLYLSELRDRECLDADLDRVGLEPTAKRVLDRDLDRSRSGLSMLETKIAGVDGPGECRLDVMGDPTGGSLPPAGGGVGEEGFAIVA